MRKSTKLSLGSIVVAGAMSAVLFPAASASATEGFVCPEGTDTITVPYAYTADNVPLLAGTVCVIGGTTVFDSVDVEDGWTAQVKSSTTKLRTEVRFTNTVTGDRVELRYEPGRTEIK